MNILTLQILWGGEAGTCQNFILQKIRQCGLNSRMRECRSLLLQLSPGQAAALGAAHGCKWRGGGGHVKEAGLSCRWVETGSLDK
jgi:hypothetical protein